MEICEVNTERLRVVPALRDLPDDELERILEIGEVRAYGDGEDIFEEGQIANALYFVLAGKIRIHRRLENGEETDLAVLEEGAILGEVALLVRRGRTAGASALGDICLLRAPRDELFADYRAGRTYSLNLLFGMARLLAERLEQMNRRVVQLLADQQPKGREFEDFKRKILDDWAV